MLRVLLLQCLFWIGATAKTDQENEFPSLTHLKGKVKYLSQKCYAVKRIRPQDSTVVTGKIIEGEDNVEVSFAKGNLIRQIIFTRVEKDTNPLILQYSYNPEMKLTQRELSQEGLGVMKSVEYTYLKNGKLYSEHYSEDGEKVEKWIYHYTPEGQKDRTEIYEYVGDREVQSQVRSPKYNDQGLKILEKRNMSNTHEVYKYQFMYDKKHRKVKEIWFDARARVSDVWKYTYTDGQLSEEVWTGPGKKKAITKYRYDKVGNIIAHKFRSRYSKTFQEDFYKYIYDEQGNWTRKIFYSLDRRKRSYVFKTVLTREITYFQ